MQTARVGQPRRAGLLLSVCFFTCAFAMLSFRQLGLLHTAGCRDTLMEGWVSSGPEGVTNQMHNLRGSSLHLHGTPA